MAQRSQKFSNTARGRKKLPTPVLGLGVFGLALFGLGLLGLDLFGLVVFGLGPLELVFRDLV